jgi:serine protein kinase
VPPETEQRYIAYLKEYLAPHYAEFIEKELQTAYLESYSEYGQNIFDRYVSFADMWIQDQEYRDPDTGEILDRASLNTELEKIEKPAGISQPEGFPPRGGQLRAARPGPEPRQEPGLDQLREAAR